MFTFGREHELKCARNYFKTDSDAELLLIVVNAIHDLIEGKIEYEDAVIVLKKGFIEGNRGTWDVTGSWIRKMYKDYPATKEIWKELATHSKAEVRFRVACHIQELPDDFVEEIQRYKVIVTYNGKCFDVPFIEGYFKIRLNQAHIDLRYILQSLDFRGGLKGCERQLGIDRGNLKDIDGFFAVLLWDEYQRTGDQMALDTLLAYNVQDTVTLENLVVTAYNMKLQQTPFHEKLLIADSSPPVNPYKVDLGTVDRIKTSPQFSALRQWY